jgi:hypothetical protein
MHEDFHAWEGRSGTFGTRLGSKRAQGAHDSSGALAHARCGVPQQRKHPGPSLGQGRRGGLQRSGVLGAQQAMHLAQRAQRRVLFWQRAYS